MMSPTLPCSTPSGLMMVRVRSKLKTGLLRKSPPRRGGWRSQTGWVVGSKPPPTPGPNGPFPSQEGIQLPFSSQLIAFERVLSSPTKLSRGSIGAVIAGSKRFVGVTVSTAALLPRQCRLGSSQRVILLRSLPSSCLRLFLCRR